MSLIFITGISTSGKSTIAKDLSNQGYEAYDTEHNGRGAWYNKQTGERVAEFSEIPERTKEWLNKHEWLVSKDWVENIAEKAVNKTIFLCGGGANESEIVAMCQKVIWLKTDEETIRRRVRNPRDHDYGTKPHELTIIIRENKSKEAEYRELGSIMIDARQPIENVINQILEEIKL